MSKKQKPKPWRGPWISPELGAAIDKFREDFKAETGYSISRKAVMDKLLHEALARRHKDRT